MQRRVQRTQKSQSQPKSKTEKVVREVGPRREEVIQTVKRKNEYMDNFSYHETKDLKRNNPRYFVVVEHTRKGDIFGDGNFEKTSYERQVYSQGGNRPKLEGNDRLRGKKPAQPAASQQVTKKTTRTTTSNTRKQNPVSATATNEKIQQTTMKRRNEGTVSKTESRTETKTTTSGVRGQKKDSTTSKTTTRTTTQKPAGV
jgi:hypothetical protein